MGKICMYCLEEFKNDEVMSVYRPSETGLYQQCPKRACEGKVFTIDDGIVPAILVLNAKGFMTHSSCSGHQLEEGSECYIEFSEDVSSLPSIPEGFRLRTRLIDGKKRLSIFSTISAEDPFDQFTELVVLWQILYEWSLDLEFNLDGLDFVFIDFDGNEFVPDFLDIFEKGAPKSKESKGSKKSVLNFDKLKETNQKASIKLKDKVAEPEAPAPETDTENTSPAEAENEPKAPKKKRGRPKKNPE